ncbi:bifunctional molybdenum cofactor biosynthesis protein MoaC/MoaB [Desertivibrio insolitus]|uniref:bifunctional molybdenum cofactor biosynthesis protein MoaC/MoaB n=1 Tax=Herbiconiux sp. SYSU D00978 TaxID=2812562 RepID=UPI001A963921|nr:bifunctional molybdenum cofactor biosynthesis protein MoaC/MoaB [Herbiconiux sp. SYSU D00978]
MSELTHLDSDGRARMVDVSHKDVTARTATAEAVFETTAEVLALVARDGLPKADVLATARLAGIQAAKRTWELIPLCHQLPLSSVKVDFELRESSIRIEATAKTTAQTGVEMEALTAASVAGLTLHDMVKAVDPAATLTALRLVAKDGGKRGSWRRDDDAERPPAPDDAEQSDAETARDLEPAAPAPALGVTAELSPDASAEALAPVPRRTARVLVSSTRAAAGEREDTTGPLIAEWLAGQGLEVEATVVVADAEIAAALADAVASAPALVLTTGGTGVSPTDRTPEATAAVLDRELPGVADAIRRAGSDAVPTSALSRGLAGLAGSTVVVNLPGSPGGVRDGLGVLEPILGHLLGQVAGEGRHD